MSKSNAYEASLLALYFNATPIANIADNAAVAPATNIYVILFTADPTETGGLADEAAYTGYARVAVARTTGGWTVSGTAPTVAKPVADITFPTCTASPGLPITHFGTSKTIAGACDYVGTVTPNITMAVNVRPLLEAATSSISED